MKILNTILSPVNLDVGSVFWYKYKGNTYGGIVLHIRKDVDFSFIAVSETIISQGIAPNVDEILCAPLYTAAWFDNTSVLPRRRLHIIGHVSVCGDYSNKAGMKVTDGQMTLWNIGGKETWGHKYWSLHIQECKMSDTTKASTFP